MDKSILVKKKSKIDGCGIFADGFIKENMRFYDVPLDKTCFENKKRCARIGNGRYVCDEKVLNFVNHSCEPNCELNISGEVPFLISLREIGKWEEITVDYRKTEVDKLKFRCNCGAKNCLDIIEKIDEIKKKGEFSQLPDSIIERVAKIAKGDVKESRALLRKYFGVFLTNKVLKIKDEKVLESHISSKGRDYSSFYQNIFQETNEVESVVDIGCGVNGFSYRYLEEVLGGVGYIGIEAAGQVVDNMNKYFKENEFNAKAICEDMFNSEKMKQIIISQHSPRVILLLQVLDALEGFEKNSSKKLLLAINETLGEKDLVVITMPMKSISGKTRFEASRNWLRYFLEENFIVEEFLVGNEMVFRARKK